MITEQQDYEILSSNKQEIFVASRVGKALQARINRLDT